MSFFVGVGRRGATRRAIASGANGKPTATARNTATNRYWLVYESIM
jgi:hypothetical protein